MEMLRLSALGASAVALLISTSGCAVYSDAAQSSTVVDQQKVNAIERAAQTHGVKVYWMTYPTKRASTAAASQQGS